MRDRFTGIFQAIRPSEQPEQVFALVTHAPPEISHALDDIRRRYDPAYKAGIEPHVTIKRPTVLGDPKRLDAIVSELSSAMAQLRPFPVVFDGYGTFKKPNANVVFLKVQDEDPFCQTHAAIIEALDRAYAPTPLPPAVANGVTANTIADHFEGQAYHPHLTIGNGLSDLELAVMEHELATGNYRLHFAFWVTEVVLMTQPGGKPWETVNTFIFSAT